MIKLTNVSIEMNKSSILKEINLSIIDGKCYGIIGRNGSGKSVLFKAIAGFIPIQTGEIWIDSHRVMEGTFLNNMGIIIESPNFINHFTALENLTCLAEIQRKIHKEEILTTLEKVGLGEAIHKKYKYFSLGMKQRLRIAQAIMENPDYYILDEPFNGLDEHGVQDEYQIIQELKRSGKTILLTSHDEKDIQTLCDSVFEIKGGLIHEI